MQSHSENNTLIFNINLACFQLLEKVIWFCMPLAFWLKWVLFKWSYVDHTSPRQGWLVLHPAISCHLQGSEYCPSRGALQEKMSYHNEISSKYWYFVSPSCWTVWRSPYKISGNYFKLALKSQPSLHPKHDCCCWSKSARTMAWLCSLNSIHVCFLLPQLFPTCPISTALVRL